MSTSSEVLAWAQRVIAKKTGPAHEVLDIKATSTADDAQTAFYKIARLAHPDLHRNSVTSEELALITSAYATAAGAYQTFRSQAATAPRTPAKPEDLAVAKPQPVRPSPGPTSSPPSNVPVDKQMNSRAIVYYRKAEIALRRGDFKGAILQIKMAIASDPASAFLRTALAEVETELRKGR
jgi:hypothetical protein